MGEQSNPGLTRAATDVTRPDTLVRQCVCLASSALWTYLSLYAPVFEINDSVPTSWAPGWFAEWSVAEFPWINTAGFQISLQTVFIPPDRTSWKASADHQLPVEDTGIHTDRQTDRQTQRLTDSPGSICFLLHFLLFLERHVICTVKQCQCSSNRDISYQ